MDSRSKNTKKGLSVAQRHLEEFLRSNELPSSDEIKEDTACDLKFFEQFAVYLTTVAETRQGEKLKASSAKQYFSGPKMVFRRRFPENKVWDSQKDEQKFSKLVNSIERRLNRSLIEKGLSLVDKARPMLWADLL